MWPWWEQVHVLTDNAGMELVSDLALAHYLLAAGPDMSPRALAPNTS